MQMTFYFCRILISQKIYTLIIFLMIVFCGSVNAATYNLSTGTYPPCVGGSGWSVSGSTYTCGGNGRVTLAATDIITASSNATIFASNGFSLAGNTIGSTGVSINLTSSYGTVTASGTNTLYGAVNGGSGDITLTNTTVNGTLTTNGNINLTGGGITGLVTSSNNTITTNGTNLSGGARAQSGMSITGGVLAGNFVMMSNNAMTLTGVTMTSGSISGASTVTIQGGSVLGSGSSSVSISSNSGAITVNNSIVYGNLTAPSYSTVNVTNGSSIYGTCSPNSTPANACGSTPPSPMSCPAGISSGITGNYYNNRTLTEPSTATRTDAPIDFNWGSAAPGPAGIGADNFSTRWSGYIRVTQSGAYRFQTVSDDGVRLYVNGNLVINNWTDHSATTDTSADVVLAAGQTYTIVLEYYENGGDAVMRLLWRLPEASSYVAIPGGPTPTLGAGLYECAPVANPPVSSCPTSLSAGITGNYFNNQTLTAPVTATRLDGPINFDWGTGAPGPAGIGDNNFSVRWSGYLHVTQSGLHRFQTNSDDGVRLTVNGNLLIDQWNDHSVTTHTSAAVSLDAGKDYPITLEFYENSGYAVVQLRWQTPGSTSYVAIPIGVNASPITSPGLYDCVTTPAGYLITNNAIGLTCAAEAIIITARNPAGATFVPASGTVVTLGTTPGTGLWVGGNTYTFTGTESSFTKYLQQTTPASLTINAASSPTAAGSSTITFADTGLKIALNSALAPIPMQTAAIQGTAVVKAIRKDDNTGACVAQIGSGIRPVSMAFSCMNPATCINQVAIKSSSIATYTNIPGNNNGAPSITYATVNLQFNGNGEAPINILYPDVGQIRMHGRMTINAAGNHPAITLTGDSDPFIVKPYTLRVTNVAQTASPFRVNPGTTNSGSGFIPAGEKFNVTVQSFNAAGVITPNFGNEISVSERNKIQVQMGCPERTTEHDKMDVCVALKPDHPVGGVSGTLTIGDLISDPPTATSAGGIFRAVWSEVGSFRLEPSLSSGYLGTGSLGLIDRVTPSAVIGRFYPDHFAVSASSLVNTCTTGSFSYMEQPLPFNYTIEARSLGAAKTTNYGPAYGTMPTLAYVAESENSGVNLGSRFNDGATKSWAGGAVAVTSANARFSRLSAPPYMDGPYPNTQIGITLTDNFDSRALTNLDMNPTTIGNCSPGGNCTAKVLGSAINMRYGRLRLDDAFGPETAILPITFITEYWTGSFFTRNMSDSCTNILRSAISYPAGNILTPANLTVGLTGGNTTGSYSSASPTEISFANGDAGHSFSAPTGGATGSFNVRVDLTSYPWLRFDWNQDGNYSDTSLPPARIGFGSYRGHDRIIYWRERFN